MEIEQLSTWEKIIYFILKKINIDYTEMKQAFSPVILKIIIITGGFLFLAFVFFKWILPHKKKRPDPTGFQKFVDSHLTDNSVQEKDNPNEFELLQFRNHYLPFQGRKINLDKLNRFLKDKRNLCWIAVTGRGGLGKSKLVYQCLSATETQRDWKQIWLEREDYDALLKFDDFRYSKNLVFVADDAAAYAAKLGEWLKKLNTAKLEGKIRVILIERDGFTSKEKPKWYDDLCGSERDKLSPLAYADADSIVPEPLTEEELSALAKRFAERQGKSLSDVQWVKVLTISRKIDGEAPSPLIVLLTVDAVIQGKNPQNMTEVMDYMLKKHEDYWKRQVKRKQYAQLETLLITATAVGKLDFRNLPDALKTQATELLDLQRSNQLQPILNAVNMDSHEQLTLLPVKPDLLGEYFVLKSWMKLILQPKQLEKQIAMLWELNLDFMWFLDRCVTNYYGDPQFSILFENSMKLFKPSGEDALIMFAKLLFNLSCDQDLAERIATVGELRKLAEKHSSDEIALVLARGLVNLSAKQDLAGREKTINELRELANEHPSDDFVLGLAKGLFNLSNEQDLAEREKTIGELRKLANEHPSDDFALLLAKGLVNLSCEQDLAGCEKTIGELRKLAEKHSSDEIALELAKGLFNLSCEQDLAGREKTINELRELANEHPSDDFALQLAEGLFNLSCEQDLAGCEKTIGELRELAEKHSSDEIALELAKGLFNLSCEQDLAGREKTINELRELANEHPSDEIALLLAEGLFNLSNKQSGTERQKTRADLKKYLSERPAVKTMYEKDAIEAGMPLPDSFD